MADQTYVQIQPYLSRTHVDDVAHARLRVKIAVDFAQRRAESKRQLIFRLCIESQHIVPGTQVSEVIVAVLIAERRRRLELMFPSASTLSSVICTPSSSGSR